MSMSGNPPQDPDEPGDARPTGPSGPTPSWDKPAPPPPSYGEPQPYGQQYGASPYADRSGGYGLPAPYGQPGGPTGGYASWGDRAVATLWDFVYLWPALVGYLVGGVVLGVGAGAESGILITLGVLILIASFVFGLWRFISNYIIDQGRTGYTYGKRHVGIRCVVEATGQVPGAASCVGRYFLHAIINQACYIDYLWPLWDDKNQTLTDKVLSTVVVKWADEER